LSPHDPESEKRTGFEAEAVLIRGRIDEVERERNLPRYGETQLPLASPYSGELAQMLGSATTAATTRSLTA